RSCITRRSGLAREKYTAVMAPAMPVFAAVLRPDKLAPPRIAQAWPNQNNETWRNAIIFHCPALNFLSRLPTQRGRMHARCK
ncbi:hypothetical protein, partial [Pseudomonas sp. NBRC 111142]|uniref:hypothetical protein n=1 Tax=Pseudomonas sp. NBRC 111142 TaxID=1661057 RepID=UPI001C47E81E